MNYIDMFILVLLIYAVFRGYTRGFIMQLTLLLALALGIFAALKLSGFTSQLLESHLSINPESLYLVSVGVTFVLVFVGINLVGRLFENLAEKVELSFINRLFGVVFSVTKMIILTGILLAFINRIDRRVNLLPKYSREHSIFFTPFTSIATTLFPSLGVPASAYEGVKEVV